MQPFETLRSILKEAVIKEEDGQFTLYTHDGSMVLGRHPTRDKALAQERAIQFHKHAAVGIPDRADFGDIKDIPLNTKLKFVVQNHMADRAGPHFDVRLGKDSLFSWASRKGLPLPGEKRLFIQQPLHSSDYADFQGKIDSGYGKGTVKTYESGSAVVTKAGPDKLNFTLLHRKFPEQFSLIRTKDKDWLALNTSPVDPHKYLNHPEAFQKLRMDVLKDPDLNKLVKTHLISAKLSGASNLFRLNSDSVDAVSYRVSKSGRPIIHTNKLLGLAAQNIKIPKALVGIILRGEIYGTQNGKAIDEQVLGGLLNSSIEKSLDKQKNENIDLKAAIFDIVGDHSDIRTKRKKIQNILSHLPKNKFSEPEFARSTKEAISLIRNIKENRHSLTNEGVVAWPIRGGRPSKLKNYLEKDVWFRDYSEGKGRLTGTGAGAISYSNTPKGKIVGEVGSGLTDETRRSIMENPKDYTGRVINVKYTKQTSNGALFQPTFISFAESPRTGITS